MNEVAEDDDDCRSIGSDLLSAELSEAALELVAAGFQVLWRGESAATEELLPGRAELAREVLGALTAGGRAERDAHGRLVGIHGLTLRTTRHRVDHGSQRHHTWCAFDTIGIPAALQLDATAHTDCLSCGAALEVTIRAGVPADDDGRILWLPAGAGDHLMDEFCASADLYCSEDHLRRRIDTTSSPGHTATLTEAAALGRDTWSDVAETDPGAAAP